MTKEELETLMVHWNEWFFCAAFFANFIIGLVYMGGRILAGNFP